MVSYADSISKLASLQTEALKWKCGPIAINVATKLNDDTLKEINLTQTVGYKNKRVPNPDKRSDANCYWLPTFFNQNEETFRIKHIYPIFVRACRDAGFKVTPSYDPKTKYVTFKCFRGKYHDEEKSKEYVASRPRNVRCPDKAPVPRGRKTQRPIKGDENNDTKCDFRFVVYWDEVKQRWFLPHQQGGCKDHCGHMHVNPSLIRLHSKHAIATDELKVAKDALNSKISATATAQLIKTRTGEELEWQQVQYLKTKDKNDLVMNAKGAQATAVDRLFANLRNDPEKSFVALFAESDKSGLLTIKTKKVNANGAETIEAFEGSLDDVTDSPQKFAETLRGNLTNSKTGQVLLAIAWTTDKARRKFDMFPEFMGGDDTEDTNSEERPLYTLLGKDNNNQSFAHTWCFMPSKAQWAFSWIFKHAVPTLHPGTAPMRVVKITTDADAQETRAVESVVGRAELCSKVIKIFPKAKHGWCGWHRINRNFTNDPKYKSMLAAAKNSSIFTRVEIDVVVRWLWYFIKHYEDEKEIQFSLNLLDFYLKEEDQSNHFGVIEESVRAKVRVFVTKSFQEHGHKLFEASFTGMTLGNVTTSINEAEHRAIKKHTSGPRPQDDIAESADKINEIFDSKENRKAKQVAFDATSTFGKAEDRDKNVAGLTDYVNKLLCRECYTEAPRHCGFRESENCFFVKRDYDKYDSTHQEDLDLPASVCQALSDQLDGHMKSVSKGDKKKIRELKEKLLGDKQGNLKEYGALLSEVMKYVIPRFERTRELKIISLPNGEFVLQCSCPVFEKFGHACRDMYFLLKRKPTLSDAKVRWHVGYGYHYGRHHVMSQHYQHIRDNIESKMPGIYITKEEVESIKSLYCIGAGDKEEEYFTRSHGKIYLRGKQNFWQTNAKKLPLELSQHFGAIDMQQCEEPCASEDTNGNGGAKSCSDVAKSGGMMAIPLGASQQVHHASSYQVPSQSQTLQEVDFGGTADYDTDDDADFHPTQGKDAYLDFLHMFQTCCKLANGNGQDGRAILERGLNNIKTELNDLNNGHSNFSEGGMGTMQATSRKRTHSRKAKASSPSRKRR